ncbi:MAG: hypothetical protein HQK77_21405, partial [Desulfobacterales bacterium]|nr:hypothetical protein [Desulfobacterales bacterium]
FKEMISYFEHQTEIDIIQVKSGKHALDMISKPLVHLAVIDENTEDISGIEFVKKLVLISPMTNSAMVSSLSEHEFHEATEGLGILMSLPSKPDTRQAELLLERLKSILLV